MDADCVEALECLGGPKDGELVLREKNEWLLECGCGWYAYAAKAIGETLRPYWRWSTRYPLLSPLPEE